LHVPNSLAPPQLEGSGTATQGACWHGSQQDVDMDISGEAVSASAPNNTLAAKPPQAGDPKNCGSVIGPDEIHLYAPSTPIVPGPGDGAL